jgi:hypothetical protein
MNEEKASFLEAVLDDPEMLSLASSYAQAEEAVLRLCKSRPDCDFAKVLLNSAWRRTLFEVVAVQMSKSDDWHYLVDNIATSESYYWQGEKSITPFSLGLLSAILSCFEPWTLIKYLERSHMKALVEHPIGWVLKEKADAFWSEEFHRRIVRKDFRRAWETIKHACTGLRIVGQKNILVASPGAIAGLLSVLHVRMQERRLIGDLGLADYSSVPAIDNKLPRVGSHGFARKPKISRNRHIPGIQVAAYVRSYDGGPETAERMALAIGRYFAERRNEKRMKRYKQLLKEHMRRQEQVTP